jgi:branched-chain amino acid transport system substrate-binding protein
MRGRACIAALMTAGALGGCATAGGGETRSELAVYVSLPLRGPVGEYGRAIRDGGRLAARVPGDSGAATTFRFLDDTASGGGPWSPVAAGDNARGATSDSATVAYVGELESGATRTSLPITNEARLLQISPASTAIDLVSAFPGSDELPEQVQPSGERTFGRVIPDDEVQAEAGAAWARELGAGTVLAVSDGSRFGDTMVEEFSEQAASEGIAVSRDDAGNPDLVYYGGAARNPLLGVLRRSDSTVIGTDALLNDRALLAGLGPLESRLRLTSAAQDPSQLPAPLGPGFVRQYRQRYGHPPDRYAAYGYEAVALVRDLVARTADEDSTRTAMIAELFETRDRDSVLGTYSIDELGDTTLDRLAGYRIRGGRPVFESALRAP